MAFTDFLNRTKVPPLQAPTDPLSPPIGTPGGPEAGGVGVTPTPPAPTAAAPPPPELGARYGSYQPMPGWELSRMNNPADTADNQKYILGRLMQDFGAPTPENLAKVVAEMQRRGANVTDDNPGDDWITVDGTPWDAIYAYGSPAARWQEGMGYGGPSGPQPNQNALTNASPNAAFNQNSAVPFMDPLQSPEATPDAGSIQAILAELMKGQNPLLRQALLQQMVGQQGQSNVVR